MKSFIVAVAITVGRINIGCKAFDAAQASVAQSNTAELIKARSAM